MKGADYIGSIRPVFHLYLQISREHADDTKVKGSHTGGEEVDDGFLVSQAW